MSLDRDVEGPAALAADKVELVERGFRTQWDNRNAEKANLILGECDDESKQRAGTKRWRALRALTGEKA